MPDAPKYRRGEHPASRANLVPFKPGHTVNVGRKRGSRNRYSLRLLDMTEEALLQLGGVAYLVEVGRAKPEVFARYAIEVARSRTEQDSAGDDLATVLADAEAQLLDAPEVAPGVYDATGADDAPEVEVGNDGLQYTDDAVDFVPNPDTDERSQDDEPERAGDTAPPRAADDDVTWDDDAIGPWE